MDAGIARIGKETDLASLARNLFVIKGIDQVKLQRRAERALLAANPRLANSEGFVKGATVIVPRVVGLSPTDRVSTGRAGIDGLLDNTAARLKIAARRIDEGVRAGEVRREAVLKLIETRSFRVGARKALPESAELIERTTKTLRKEAEVSETRAKALRSAVESAMAEVERLTALVDRRP